VLQRGQQGNGDVPLSGEVHFDDLIPLLHLIRIVRPDTGRDARIIHQYVDLAVSPYDATAEGHHCLTVTDVQGLGSGEEAYLTLAAVDEGILQLTDFVSPNPNDYYFGKRSLGVAMDKIELHITTLNPGEESHPVHRHPWEEMLLVKDGHLSELTVLFDRYQVSLYNFFLKLTGDKAASQDLTQNLFYRVIRYRQSFQPSHGSFRSWIYRIARNVHMDFCKQDILQYQPDALILIDYPGFNMRIAKWARSIPHNFRIIYYISPQVWAWKESRVKHIRENIDKMLVILPFEKDFFQ